LHVIFAEGLHDEAWLEANSVGWRELRERTADYPSERVAEITGLSADTIVALARRYATTKPALLKFSDGIQRHGNGGQTVRAMLCLAAVTGNIGTAGGGVFYSMSGYVVWDGAAIGHAAECPPTPRIVNMNRLGAALLGEVSDPPIVSLYVFNANPVTSTPNTGRIIEGLLREDVFTVVHDLFMTDTAQYADIVLPATSQLEQVDLHKGYGHRFLQWNAPAIAPLGEAKSNWDVSRLLAAEMGYQEPWLRAEPEDVLGEILDATAAHNALLDGVSIERLKRESTVPFNFDADERPWVPFADLRFPTPSGKVELFCAAMTTHGLDPLPDYCPPEEFAGRRPEQLVLVSGAAHHFVSSSLANVPKLLAKEGHPLVELHPADAAARGICDGDDVVIANARGEVTVRAVLTTDVQPGVAVAPKGNWARLSPHGRNINWVTSDALADLAGQSTFHSNLVEIRKAGDA
jgi:anaerobic selenocysteine-containing dehydrogenase